MRLTDFWFRLEQIHGPQYARSWAQDFVLTSLEGRTVEAALTAGVETRVVWDAVADALELTPHER